MVQDQDNRREGNDSSSSWAGAGATGFTQSNNSFNSVWQTAKDDGNEGRPKSLPRDVHLPLPMFYDTPQQNPRASSSLRLASANQEQCDGVPPEQRQHMQTQTPGERGQVLLQSGPGTPTRDAREKNVIETLNPGTTTKEGEWLQTPQVRSTHPACAALHTSRSATQRSQHAFEESRALPEDRGDSASWIESGSRNSNTPCHANDRYAQDGSRMRYTTGGSDSFTADAAEEAVRSREPDLVGLAYRPRERGTTASTEVKFQEFYACALPFSSTDPLQHDPPAGGKKSSGATSQQCVEEETCSVHSSGQTVAGMRSRTETRVLQVAAQFIPGRINPSVAAAMLQACADTGHRNIIFLSCLIASLKAAVSQVQRAPSRQKDCAVGAAPWGKHKAEIAATLQTPSRHTGSGWYPKVDSSPVETAHETCCITAHTDQPRGAPSKVCTLVETSLARLCDSNVPANVDAQISKQPAETGGPSTPEEDRHLSPRMLESLMTGKCSTANGGIERTKRRSFVGLHEVRGLVFTPVRGLQLAKQQNTNSQAMRSSSSSSVPEDTATMIKVEEGDSFQSHLTDIHQDEPTRFVKQQCGVNCHAPTREGLSRLYSPTDVSGNGRNDSCSPNTRKVTRSNCFHETMACHSESPRSSAGNIRWRATDIDERQLRDLQCLAAEVNWGTGFSSAGISESSVQPAVPAVSLASSRPSPPAPQSSLERHAATSSCRVVSQTVGVRVVKKTETANSQSTVREGPALYQARPSPGPSGKSVCHPDTGLGDYKTDIDNAHEEDPEHQEVEMLKQRGRRSSGMMRFRYNRSFFQRLRQAAMLSQGTDSEIEKLSKSEYLRAPVSCAEQQSGSGTKGNVKVSKGGRIARVATLVPADSHVERRVSAEEKRQAFWERLLKGKRHPQARRLLHRRFFRVACSLRALDLSQRYCSVDTLQDFTTASKEDHVEQADDDETARHNIQRRLISRRLANNFYRPAQAVQRAMRRWSALRRSFLMPYQEHARVIQEEMRHVQQTSPQALAVLDSTFCSHRCLNGDNRDAPVPPASTYLYMYFLSASPSLGTSHDSAHLPFLVDTQLLLPPEIHAPRGHWLAQSRLRCLYSRILRDNKRSQRLLKDKDAGAGLAAQPSARDRPGILQHSPPESMPMKHRDAQVFPQRTSIAEGTDRHILLLRENNSVTCDPGLTMDNGENSTTIGYSASCADNLPDSLQSSRALFPRDAADKALPSKDAWRLYKRGSDGEVTSDGGLTQVASLTSPHASNILMARMNGKKEAAASATEACELKKTEAALPTMTADRGEAGGRLNECSAAHPLNCPALREGQASNKSSFPVRPLLKRVPLLQEASTALQALMKLRFFPAGVLLFLVGHVFWGVRVLAKHVMDAMLHANCAPAAAKSPPFPTAEASASGHLPDSDKPREMHRQSKGSNFHNTSQGSTDALPNVTASCHQQVPAVSCDSLACQRLPHAVTLHLLSVLRTVNIAAAAATAAVTTAAEKPAKATHSALPVPAASLLCRRGNGAVPTTEELPIEAAPPPAEPLTPPTTLLSSQQVEPTASRCRRSTTSCEKGTRKPRQQENNGFAKIVLSHEEAGAVCSLLETCYRSIALIPLLTTRHKPDTRMGGHESHTAVILDALQLYTALLRHQHRGEENGVFFSVKHIAHAQCMSTSWERSAVATWAGLPPRTQNPDEIANHMGETVSRLQARARRSSACDAYSGGEYVDVPASVHDATQTKQLEISKGSFLAILAKYLVVMVGISASPFLTCPFALRKTSCAHGCPPEDRQRLREKHSPRIADGHCHCAADTPCERFTMNAAGCGADTSAERKEGRETKMHLITRDHVFGCELRSTAETTTQTVVNESASIPDRATGSKSFLQARRPDEHATATKNFSRCERDITGLQESRARRTASREGTEPFSMACRGSMCNAFMVKGQNWYRMIRKYARGPVGGELPVRLNTEQMSTLLRTVVAVDELSIGNDAHTADLLKMLRRVLHRRLKRIVCGEGHRSLQGDPEFCAFSPDLDDTSTAAENADHLLINTARQGESRRVLLTALVALTLDEISWYSHPVKEKDTDSDRHRDVPPDGESFTGIIQTCCPKVSAGECRSYCSTKPEENFAVSRLAESRQKACSLEAVVAKFSSAAGVPGVLLRKLVERELARQRKQFVGAADA